MSDLVKSGASLAERLAGKLTQKALEAPQGPKKGVLLLDVSGSMADMAEAGLTKIAALRLVVRALNPERIFTFSDDCVEQKAGYIPDPQTDTHYGRAFRRMKAEGITSVVMVTDGWPTDPQDSVLEEAKGLKVEIVYVGPEPRPPFLATLAQHCGGTVTTSTLKRADMKQLARKMAGFLTETTEEK